MQFMPSDRVLEEICGDREELIFYHTRIPSGLSQRQIEATLTLILVGAMNQIAENFGWGLGIQNRMNAQRVIVVWEALKNAIVYGSRNQAPVYYGLFLGDKGVCHGFKDEGDYFKSEDVKRRFENKDTITEFQQVPEEFSGFSGYRAGVNHHIYPYSDIIEVDTGEGVLYCVQYRRSLENI